MTLSPFERQHGRQEHVDDVVGTSHFSMWILRYEDPGAGFKVNHVTIKCLGKKAE